MAFSGTNYEDAFVSDLVDFVAAESFQSMFENFFIQHALKFSLDEERKWTPLSHE
jgi:hypothetical protein